MESRKKQIGLLLATTIPVLGIVGWWALAEVPPTAAFNNARGAIAEARKESAERYAPAPFRRAEAAWQLGLESWRTENRRAAPFRSYRSAVKLAEDASSWAEVASARARTVEDSLLQLITAYDGEVLESIRTSRDLLRRLPGDSTWSAGLNEAAFFRQQALSLQSEDQLGAAAARLQAARTQVRAVRMSVTEYVDRMRADLPEWKVQYTEIVRWSANQKQTALVVDKMNRVLYVVKAGRVVDSIAVDLGPGWDRPKLREGDRATPEGFYRITRKRGPGATRYHRALDLDYPNPKDRDRFKQAMADGELSPDARIGGAIEIHGEGGSGADWTDGCVALANRSMDRLFERVATGTPVLIVRALRLPSVDIMDSKGV